MSDQKSPRPYVFHLERLERYNRDLVEIERRKGYPDRTAELKAQALENLCWSEYIDASMVLTGKRVRVHQAGFALSYEYIITKISKVEKPEERGNKCFTIHFVKPGNGEEDRLDIAPTTKIWIFEEELQPACSLSA